MLLDLNVQLVTTPNFSVVADVPRWDNLYAMKKIAWLWFEMASAGVPTALHLNGRTERDWDRWATFVFEHEEIDCVSFEFGTGGRSTDRIQWYGNRLEEFAEAVERPLTAIVRGGRPILAQLFQAFHRLVFVDTNAFSKTIKRQKLTYSIEAGLRTAPHPTEPMAPIDDLLVANVCAMKRCIESTLLVR